MNAPLTHIAGRAYPFGMKNCDTDVIIGAEWLKTISRQGLGTGAFAALRDMPGHILAAPEYAGSPILIAGDNFGCGSSREHAAWALADFGIRAIVAPSFSDIFSSNAFKNGILTLTLPQQVVDHLMAIASEQSFVIDLAAQRVASSAGDIFDFEIDPFRKYCLLNGLDEIDITLSLADKISRFEEDSPHPSVAVRRPRSQALA
ncbi:3-isopropylmalate dehydratase small subunit [Sphingopyxis sp. JAI108]|uniref:3-isopropylmalate dehydratase small subunit n=1 Tax=Sphingopyxis sp. JAI108 TaxID=2723060 RepID=UPI0015C6EA6D|nr:3-isopropylmalate dehydratase small subunit [Sphingopyxis sp. JAI108]NYF33962.1 3-isopropylmalate dehydratase small subunit [Sphingopyxis sp. JAI108]